MITLKVRLGTYLLFGSLIGIWLSTTGQPYPITITLGIISGTLLFLIDYLFQLMEYIVIRRSKDISAINTYTASLAKKMEKLQK